MQRDFYCDSKSRTSFPKATPSKSINHSKAGSLGTGLNTSPRMNPNIRMHTTMRTIHSMIWIFLGGTLLFDALISKPNVHMNASPASNTNQEAISPQTGIRLTMMLITNNKSIHPQNSSGLTLIYFLL